MRTRSLTLVVFFLATSFGCEKSATLVREPPPQPAIAPLEAAPAQKLAVGPSTDGKPPLLGSDPYGLLSRKPGTENTARREPVDPSKLDPGAMMARGTAPSATAGPESERDPRAVARSQVTEERLPSEGNLAQRVLDVSADDVVARVRRGTGRPHILLLYGAFCGVCRRYLPDFVDATRAYHRRGVGFTLASIDSDRAAFEAYVPTLRRFFEPLLISHKDEATVAALRRLGPALKDEGMAVPLAVVFDKQGKIVAKGRGDVMKNVVKLLDGLI